MLKSEDSFEPSASLGRAESERIAKYLGAESVIHSGEEVQRYVLLCMRGWSFDTSHYQGVSLTCLERRLRLFLSHSRVIRCDFIES
jgi:hypothetical protein